MVYHAESINFNLSIEQPSTFYHDCGLFAYLSLYLTLSNLSLELRTFQRLLLKGYEEESKTPYDKENPVHEEHLMLLWTTVFPSTKLESRVSEQWKLLGFQGTDPATDFRGMGICGLNNLLYFAENHTDLLRRFCKEQQARGDALYPVATAGNAQRRGHTFSFFFIFYFYFLNLENRRGQILSWLLVTLDLLIVNFYFHFIFDY
tara:strand:- start:391 stop:1002 length:612 start_codon:yes stop_codon:yes gene_type:complete